MTDTTEKIACPLCGFRYEKDSARCAGCPMGQSCTVICCPHCGYKTVDESWAESFIDKLRRFIKWLKKIILKKKY
ncbi:MAG: hypothetical protein JW969_18750 [Spirochaetales bacterium]|nr:hypothetical protein [Spirochaetales bacterium]